MNGYFIISSAEADLSKYDACILSDPNSTPFVESWYLNITAGLWCVITDASYTTVFPFAVRSRFGIQYIYQPFFNRHTGIFGNDKAGLLNAIDQGLLSNYRLWDFYADDSISSLEATLQQRKYQALDLTRSYDYLCEKYTSKLKRNLRLAEKDNVNVVVSYDLHNFDLEFRKHTGEQIKEFKDSDYVTLKKLAETTVAKEGSILLESIHENKITAAALFYESNNSILYIEGYSTPEGRSLRSMHKLFDHIIKQFAGSGKCLDFGGSNHESIARFFHSFGAVDQTYYHVYRNRLPVFIKWLKKIRN